MIEDKGARVVFLPPYSPELNPIEPSWSKLKTFIRKQKPRSMMDIDIAVAAALPTISHADSIGWFEHCGINVHYTVEQYHNL